MPEQTTAIVLADPAQLLRIGILPTNPDAHPALVYLARLAPGSRRTMGGALDTMAAILIAGADRLTCPWHLLRYQHTQALRARLADRYAPATANKHMAALRGVIQEAWRLGLIGAEDYRRAADVASVRGTRLQKGRALAARELRLLLEGCDDGTPAGIRDRALLAILYSAGLRRSEASALHLSDYDAGESSLAVRAGKGNKARVCYLNDRAAGALDGWVALRGPGDGPLFARIRAGGHMVAGGLTDEGIAHVLEVRRSRAGLAPCSPHDLRRTFISDLLDAGADIATVQQLAGHSQVTTTQRYDRRGEATKRRAANLLRV